MLLDTIKRLQAKTVTLVSIEGLRHTGRALPPQIHSVPALMLMPSKQLLFGKQVFDYLLLPGKGALTTGISSQKPTSQKVTELAGPGEPQAFTLHVSNFSGDNYAFIDDDKVNGHRSYTWTSIDNIFGTTASTQSTDTTTGIQSSTRVKKEVLDLEEFKAKRAEDLNLTINTTVSTPPAITY